LIAIKPYSPARGADFLRLNRALLTHYGIDPATGAQETDLLRLMDAGRYLSCDLAYVGGQPAGFATWTLVFPTGTGLAMFLKELFIAPDHQGAGVGLALMGHLARTAKREGCKRIDWQTDAKNLAARAFYAKLNAPMVDKISYRLPASGYQNLIARAGLENH
jgi:GNAT superfamily N-acetyltransferase